MRFISHVGRVDIMVDTNHCVSCHEVIPFGMSKCSKCRSEETFARKKSRAKYDKCSDCGADGMGFVACIAKRKEI